MNTIATQNNQLPAYLQQLVSDPRFTAPSSALSAGISQGGWPRISIKASRFRLQSPQGAEVVVQDTFLDVVIVDANTNISKIYYKQAYDAKSDDGNFKAPDCYSDNGVAPSSKAASPQCGTCQACPHNIWGSKISPNGAQTKACADSKKVAVLIADNPDGPVFELRVPAASLKNLGAYGNELTKRAVQEWQVVTRLSFDENSDFPKLVFKAISYISPEHAAALVDVKDTEEVNQCTGKNDKPIVGNPAIAAPLPPRAELPPVITPSASAVQQPLQQQNATAAQSGLTTQVEEKPKRTRRTKEQMAAAPAVPPTDMFASQASAPMRNAQAFTAAPLASVQPQARPPFLQSQVAPAHGAVLNPPTVTDAVLVDLIAKAMAV